MAIEAGDFRTGLTLIIEGNLYVVLDFMHVKPGKGAAILKTKLKNLRTGSVLDRNFNTNTKFEQALIERKAVQYNYNADGVYYFMDMESYDTYELTEEVLGFAKNFLIDGMECFLKFFGEETLDIDLPDKVVLQIVDTIDDVQNNVSGTATKDAVLETGLKIKVPMFVKNGEKVIVFTADGSYSGRA